VPGFIAEPVSRSKELLPELMKSILGTDKPLPMDRIQRVIDQYNTGIRHADAATGAVLAKLGELGMMDNTLVVVTSDHGESFGEHRLIEHCLDLYEPEIRVPLVVKFPGQTAAKRIDDPVSLVHFPRLALGAIGGVIEEKLRGRFPYAPDGGGLLCENELMGDRKREFNRGAYGGRFDRNRTGYIRWPHKFIQSSTGETELYNLETGPGELDNLAAKEATLAQSLQTDMRALLDSRPHWKASGDDTEPARELSPEDTKDLDALGYL
jgi:arylsulfatase A-like enzyme